MFRPLASSIIGGGHILMYSCSQTIKTIDCKRNCIFSCAEHEYMNMCPPINRKFNYGYNITLYFKVLIDKRKKEIYCHIALKIS